MRLPDLSQIITKPRFGRRRAVARMLAAANAANASRHWAEAAAFYAKVLAVRPSRGEIWVQYGHALKEQGYLHKAEEAYSRALRLDSAVADTHLQVGHVLKLQGRLAAAETAYRNAYLLDPLSPHSRAELEAAGVELPASAKSGSVRVTAILKEEMPTRVWNGTGSAATIAKSGSQNTRRAASQSLSDELSCVRLASRALDHFDFKFYFYVNINVQALLAVPDPEKCLLHFRTSGIDDLLTIGEHLDFDADFYRQTYLPHLSFTPVNAYRHWLTVGVQDDWAPNRTWWLRHVFDGHVDEADGLNIMLAAATRGEAFLKEKWTTQFEWFANSAVADQTLNISVTPATADTLATLADRLAVKGSDEKALALYQRILLHVPGHQHTTAHYADALLRRGCVLEASKLYRHILKTDLNPSVWAYINLAVCHQGLGQRHDAVTTLSKGVGAYPGDMGLRRRFGDLARTFLTQEWDMAVSEARLGSVEQAQTRLRLACQTVSSCFRGREKLPARPVRSVALLANQDLAQCRFYRVEQKVEQLRLGGYKVTLYDFRSGVTEFMAEMHRHQAAIFYRVPALYDVIAAIEKARELGIITIYEIDDLIFDAAEYPGALASYDGQIGSEEFIGLQLGVPLFEGAMSLCEYGLASTSPLARFMEKRVESGTVLIHRNGFGIKHETYAAMPSSNQDSERVVVFYGSGTKAHKEDFQQLVEPALVDLVRRFGNRVGIILMGYVSMTERLSSIASNVTIIPPDWDVDRYWAMLSQIDVNIAVLKSSLMADCKSEIKWTEAAMFGIPSVVSATATFDEVIEHGVTGLLCRTAEDWTSALGSLVGDQALRKRIGSAAKRRVQEAYGIQPMAANLGNLLRQMQPLANVPKKPVILIVNVFYPPQAIGGATRVVHDNVRRLVQAHGSRFQIEVFTTVEGGSEPYQTTSYALDGARVTGVTTPDDPDIESRTQDPRMLEVFDQFLDCVQPDLIHFHCIQRLTTSVLTAAQWRRIPYVVSVHDGWWISTDQFLLDKQGRMRLYDYTFPLQTLETMGSSAFNRLMSVKGPLTGATRVLAVSEPFAKIYQSCGVPNVMTIANGVSTLLKPERTLSKDSRVRLGFIGGLAVHKGYDLIKYALYGQRLRNVRLIVIDHAMQPGVSRAEVWGETEVEFRPKSRQQEVGLLYGEIDVLLAPSIWPESYGLVTREALHCGCWVVCSDRGSIGEYVVNDQNGFIVDASGPEQLAVVLRSIDANSERFLSSPVLRPIMRRADEQTDDLAKLYDDLLAVTPTTSQP